MKHDSSTNLKPHNPMYTTPQSTQTIAMSTNKSDLEISRKQERIELRAFKGMYPLTKQTANENENITRTENTANNSSAYLNNNDSNYKEFIKKETSLPMKLSSDEEVMVNDENKSSINENTIPLKSNPSKIPIPPKTPTGLPISGNTPKMMKTKNTEGPNITTSTPPNPPIDKKSFKRSSVFCCSEEINLKALAKFTLSDSLFSKTILYYGECLFSNVKFNIYSDLSKLYSPVLFFKYGVIVTWGLSEKQEKVLLEKVSGFLINEYDDARKEFENFHYTTTTKEPYFSDDVFFLANDNENDYFTKMVISNALAQSVKLDYFEGFVDETIEMVRFLPSQIEVNGKIDKTRAEIFQLIGKLFRIKFDINLVSNILDEPEILWYHSDYAPLYDNMKHCLEIKGRAELLNRRCDTMQNLLECLYGQLGGSGKPGKDIAVWAVFGLLLVYGFSYLLMRVFG